MSELVFICPHCNNYLIMKKLNCGIFRHGVFIKDNKQIDPHSSKENCDNYVKNNLIYGCGKPFRITNVDNKWLIETCDYI